MQDCYTGDIGDFGKYGLLRHLVQGTGRCLGIAWWLVEDGSTGDGRLVSYLTRDNRGLSPCDPFLYATLGHIVRAGNRRVRAIETSALFPEDTEYFTDLVPVGVGLRDAWVARMTEKMRPCDFVFLDPDNGLEVASTSRSSRGAVKYVYYREIKPLLAMGKSVIIYHHASRQGSVGSRVARRLETLRGMAPSATVRAVLYRRGTVRAYLLVAAPEHGDLLARWDALRTNTGWHAHFDSA